VKVLRSLLHGNGAKHGGELVEELLGTFDPGIECRHLSVYVEFVAAPHPCRGRGGHGNGPATLLDSSRS